MRLILKLLMGFYKGRRKLNVNVSFHIFRDLPGKGFPSQKVYQINTVCTIKVRRKIQGKTQFIVSMLVLIRKLNNGFFNVSSKILDL